MSARIVLVFVLCLAPSVALAQGGPATHAIEQRHAELTSLLTSAGGDEGRVTAVLAELIDYEAMAQRIHGDRWAQRTAAEQAAYVAALRDAILSSYGPRVSHVTEYRVRFAREEPGTEPVVHVTARPVAEPRAEPWQIACHVHRVGDDWRVIDIVTNDSSLVAAYRHQADRTLRDESWDALIAHMHAAAHHD